MQHFSRIVARNSAFSLAAQLIIKVLSFGFSILIVRNLGAEVFGQYSGVAAFGMVFVFLADLGLAPYAVRQVARWRESPDGLTRANDLYSNLLALRLILALITAIVIVAFAALTQRPIVMIGAIALNAFSLLLYAVQSSSGVILTGFERLDLTSGANVVNAVAHFVKHHTGRTGRWRNLHRHPMEYAYRRAHEFEFEKTNGWSNHAGR